MARPEFSRRARSYADLPGKAISHIHATRPAGVLQTSHATRPALRVTSQLLYGLHRRAFCLNRSILERFIGTDQ